jgi:hypothetical protein
MGRRTRTRLLAGGLGVIALVGLAAGAAGAATGDVVCDGGAAHHASVSHVRIEGDLVVAPATYCSIDHVYVAGRLVVRSSPAAGDFSTADLISSEVRGETVIEAGRAGLDARRSTLRDVVLQGGAPSVYLTLTTVRGTVRGTVGYLSAFRARLVRGVDVHRPTAAGAPRSVVVDSTTVDGDVRSSGLRVDLTRAQLTGGLRVLDARGLYSHDGPGHWGLRVCESAVAGQVRVVRSHDLVAIGGHPDGAGWGCDPTVRGPNRTGPLSIVDNHYSVTVGNTTVDGDLRCYGNTGPRGVDASRATVTGERLGQCA